MLKTMNSSGRQHSFGKLAARAAGLALLIVVASYLAPVNSFAWSDLKQIGNWKGQYNAGTPATHDANVTLKVDFRILHVKSSGDLKKYSYTGTLSCKDCKTVTTSARVQPGDGKTASIGSATITIPRKTTAYTASVSVTVKNTSTGSVSNKQTIKVSVPALASYNVVYDANGGTAPPPAQKKYYGINLTLSSAAPGYEGRTFAGWNTKADGSGSSYAPGGTYAANAAVTLYAKWTDIPEVRFNANGGSLSGNEGQDGAHSSGIMIAGDGTIMRDGTPLTVVLPEKLIAPTGGREVDLSRPGYHIEAGKEWNDQPDGRGRSFSAGTAYAAADCPTDVLYANWKANSYTVSFLPNGEGDVSGTMPDQTLEVDQAARLQSNSFIRPGYRLAGWDVDPDADPDGRLTVAGDSGTVLNLNREPGERVTLYAIWSPVSEDGADINIGKIVKHNAKKDSYSFTIEAVEGWRHENASTLHSGEHIDAEDVPMPEGTPDGADEKKVEVSGLAGNDGVLRSASAGIITFEDPGWYMYRIYEDVPGAEEGNHENDGISYDRTSYYVVVYAEYMEDSGYKVRVRNITAWHNSRGSDKQRPDLEDMAAVTDNEGKSALNNEEKVYGKTGTGINSILVRFWNDEADPGKDPGDAVTGFRISKKVTGSLGDITKRFEFTLKLSGLASNTTYAVLNEGASLDEGFSGNSFSTDGSGSAELEFRLRDDEGFTIEDMPAGAVFSAEEAASDHLPSFTVTPDSGGSGDEENAIKKDRLNSCGALSTGPITMNDPDDLYNVIFTNTRDLTVNTGIAERGVPAAAALIAVLMIAAAAAI